MNEFSKSLVFCEIEVHARFLEGLAMIFASQSTIRAKLLERLRERGSVDDYDRTEGDKLVFEGLAATIPSEGMLEITEAGRDVQRV